MTPQSNLHQSTRAVVLLGQGPDWHVSLDGSYQRSWPRPQMLEAVRWAQEQANEVIVRDLTGFHLNGLTRFRVLAVEK